MDTGVAIGLIIGIGIVLFLVGAALAFFLTKRMFEKQIKENPPITEKMIRAMFLQMGRKPSEAQIKAIMRSMQNAKRDKK
ncbi:MAG: YneF family protein [Mycoplasma sp.]|nr:YneF family protein [Mycoplasma sp.]